MSRADRLRQLDIAHVWHPYTQMSEYPDAHAPIIERGEGVYVYDVNGKRYLDGYAQMWCNVFGHNDPELNATLREQSERIAHSSLFSASNVPSIELAEQLAELAGREFGLPIENALPHAFFSDNGSTAVEVALKIALQYHRNLGNTRRLFLTFSDAYHGDTGATLTLGGVELFRTAYEPITFSVLRAPYPMCSRPDLAPKTQETREYENAVDQLRAIFDQHGADIAAAIIEPRCQGTGGIRPMFPGFLKELRRLCDMHGALLIADEVLVAFGRGGCMFASAAEKVQPDLLCLGKGLTAGYLPFAATLARHKVFEAFLGKRNDFRHLLHGHTFTGNQLGASLALKTLELFEKRKLIDHIAALQPFIHTRLKRLETINGVGGIRHVGMMTGIQIGDGREGYDGDIGLRICAEALRRGTIIRPLGNIVVLMPILCSTERELGELFDITEQAITACLK